MRLIDKSTTKCVISSTCHSYYVKLPEASTWTSCFQWGLCKCINRTSTKTMGHLNAKSCVTQTRKETQKAGSKNVLISIYLYIRIYIYCIIYYIYILCYNIYILNYIYIKCYIYYIIYIILVNYNDLTVLSLTGIMVNKGNHPQMALNQVSERFFLPRYMYKYITS